MMRVDGTKSSESEISTSILDIGERGDAPLQPGSVMWLLKVDGS